MNWGSVCVCFSGEMYREKFSEKDFWVPTQQFITTLDITLHFKY